MRAEGSVAVITGGGAGIGRALALELAERDAAAVIIGDVDERAAQAVADEVDELGSNGHAVACDVRSDSEVAALADVARGVGPVDLLFLHAGGSLAGPAESIPATDWLDLFDLNLGGIVRGLEAFLEEMIERGRGRVVVTSSSLGLFANLPFGVPYISSKAAIFGLGMGLDRYLAPHGLRASVLAPDLTATAFPSSIGVVGADPATLAAQGLPSYRPDTPADVARLTLDAIENDQFLISLYPNSRDLLVQQAEVMYDHTALPPGWPDSARPTTDVVVQVGRIRIAAENHAAAVDMLTSTARASLDDPGCIEYRFAADLTEPGLFYLHEIWASEDDLEAHAGAPHSVALLNAAAEMGVREVEMTRFDAKSRG